MLRMLGWFVEGFAVQRSLWWLGCGCFLQLQSDDYAMLYHYFCLYRLN